MKRCVQIAAVALVVLAAAVQAADFTDRGWAKVQADPEIWKDANVQPPRFYNKDAIAMVAQADGTYKVDRNQPMTFSQDEGETSGLEMATRPDGQTTFKLQEDNNVAKISEHSVTYNDSAMKEALVADGTLALDQNGAAPDPNFNREVTWVVRDEAGNEVQNQTGTNTSYAPTFNTPGLYNLSNGGVSSVNDAVVGSGTYSSNPTNNTSAGGTFGTDPNAQAVVANGTFTSGQNAELEVVDVTPPPEGIVKFIPEDHFEENQIVLAAGSAINAYPMTEKKCDLQVKGKNFAKDGATNFETAAPVEKSVQVPYGTPYVPDQYKDKGTTVADVGNGKKEVYLRTDNKIDFAKETGVQGLFVPVHVRTRFVVGPFTDNRKNDPVKTSFELVVNRDGTEEKLEEPPSYTFPVANYDDNGPIAGAPTYTFTYNVEDLSGNKTSVSVPVHVLPVGVRIQDIDVNQGKGD